MTQMDAAGRVEVCRTDRPDKGALKDRRAPDPEAAPPQMAGEVVSLMLDTGSFYDSAWLGKTGYIESVG